MPQTRKPASHRRRLRDAVVPGVEGSAPSPAQPAAALSGLILDASPHLLVLVTTDGEQVRLPMSEATTVWYAGRAGLSALQAGRRVIVRPTSDGLAADRIWVEIVRMTGTIVERDGGALEIDEGPHRGGRTNVFIPQRALGRVMVRHPHYEPGYLADVIGVRSADGPVAVRPGTPQPDYPAAEVPRPQPAGPTPDVLRGTATWFSGPGRRAAYPAVDPFSGGCPDTRGCAALPYLSLGSELHVRNECTGRAMGVPVTQCGCVAARFCDRCVECATSPRGRILELTPASFVDLGGELEAGCFNVTVRVR
jgi:hypothetical protein